MTKIDVRHIQEWRDKKTGRIYRYTRSPPLPARVRLHSQPGTLEFFKEYSAVVNMTRPEIGASHTISGTMSDLIARFIKRKMTGLSPVTRRSQLNILEQIRVQCGHLPVAKIERRHIRDWMANRAEKGLKGKAAPTSANIILSMLRRLMKLAIEEEMRETDPTAAIDKARTVAKGFPDWGEAPIAAFENFYPIGSVARLVMALLVYVGCRIGDVVNLGPANLKLCNDPELLAKGVHFMITYVQDKYHLRKPVLIEDMPMHPELERIIAATPIGKDSFVATRQGKPYTKGSMGNYMRDWCDAAGLPEIGRKLSSHGLRKAFLRRWADLGIPPHYLKALGGHTTLKEVMHYTEAHDQKLARREAMSKLLTVKTPAL